MKRWLLAALAGLSVAATGAATAATDAASGDLYRSLKERGDAVPAWLQLDLFPGAGGEGAGRQGGDDAASATLIADASWGACYEDAGSTTGLANALPSGQAHPASCDFGFFPISFSAPDAWYRFVLDETTYVEATTCRPGTAYDTALALLDAEGLPVALDDDESCAFADWRSTVACCLPAGEYYAVVDGYNSTSFGAYEVEICFGECPSDPCAAYAELVGTGTAPCSLIGDNSGYPDILSGLGGDAGFDVTIPEAGEWSFDACNGGTAYSVDLYLYDGSPCEGGSLLHSNTWTACDNPAAPSAARLGNLLLQPGVYHLVVSEFGPLEGPFQIDVYRSCDLYADATLAATAPAVLTGSTVGQPDVHGGGGGDQGWDVTIPEAGLWDFDACMPGTDYDVDLWLFDASPCEGGALVASSLDSRCRGALHAARLREVQLEAGVYHLLAGHSWATEGAVEIDVAQTPDWPTQGGPDAAGTVWISSLDPDGPAYSWIDIAANPAAVSVTLSDDQFRGPYALGIDFPFYGVNRTQCWIGSNGIVSFSAGSASADNQWLPDPAAPNDLIAAWWDDLDPGQGGTVKYLSDPQNDRFVVQFTGVPDGAGGGSKTFQAVLMSSGDVLVQLASLTGDAWGSTIGVENADGSTGLSYVVDHEFGALQPQLAVLFDFDVGDVRPPVIAHVPTLDVIETEVPGDYAIAATLTDDTGVASATVRWRANNGAWQSAAMNHQAGDLWAGAIPHQAGGVDVDYYIQAVDATPEGYTRTSPTWSFEVISYHWPPLGVNASDGLFFTTQISWLHPADPALFAPWFGDDVPVGEDEALQRLMDERGLAKDDALALWRRLTEPAGRVFEEYNVYRDGDWIGTTMATSFVDNADGGSEMDVVYDYTVTAVFDLGESDPSTADEGHWSGLPTWGGPDAFGYTWIQSLDPGGPDYEWVDISGTGETVALSDDNSAGPFELGFSFPFYSNFYTDVYIGSNGFLSFGSGSGSLGNQVLPDPNAPNDLIAMFWDDINPGSGGTVYYESDPESGRFIVQFQGVPAFGGSVPMTWEAILDASGRILINHDDIDENDLSSATVGVENIDGTIGLSANANGAGCFLGDGIAFLFLPPSSCEPVDCAGEAETEPNEGWDDGNASYEIIRCDETWCGTVLDDGQTVDRDWYRYTHFGGDVVFSIEVADFDPRLRLVEFEPGGATIATASTFPRCFGETLSISGLASGTYFLVVEHVGDSDVTEPQTYALTLECSGDPCAGHEPVDCAGTAETEPNEGWNDGNESYGEIAIGETVCGSVWADGGQRDLDWFHFTLDVAADVLVNVEVDAFDAALFVTDFDPEGAVLQEADLAPPCHPEELAIAGLPAGDYFVVVGHAQLDGVPDPQAYALTLSLEIPVEAMCDNYLDGGTLGEDWYTVQRPAPGFVHHDGTGCPGGVASPGRDEVHRLVLAQATDVGVTLLGDGDADEVILLVGDCANPHSSCGAAKDDVGAGAEAEELVVPGLPAGDYFIVADFAGAGETHPYTITVRDLDSALDPARPLDFALEGVFPNPFNPTTVLRWTQPELLPAELVVHNLLGEEVERLELGFRGPGRQSFSWNAARLGSGVYLCTLRSGPHSATVKALLIK